MSWRASLLTSSTALGDEAAPNETREWMPRPNRVAPQPSSHTSSRQDSFATPLRSQGGVAASSQRPRAASSDPRGAGPTSATSRISSARTQNPVQTASTPVGPQASSSSLALGSFTPIIRYGGSAVSNREGSRARAPPPPPPPPPPQAQASTATSTAPAVVTAYSNVSVSGLAVLARQPRLKPPTEGITSRRSSSSAGPVDIRPQALGSGASSDRWRRDQRGRRNGEGASAGARAALSPRSATTTPRGGGGRKGDEADTRRSWRTPSPTQRQRPHVPNTPSLTSIHATSPGGPPDAPSALSSSPASPAAALREDYLAMESARRRLSAEDSGVTPAFFRAHRAHHSVNGRTDSGGGGAPRPPASTDWVGLQIHLRARTQATGITVLDLSSFRVKEEQWRWFCREALPTLHALRELLLADMGLGDSHVHELLVQGCQVGRLDSGEATGKAGTERNSERTRSGSATAGSSGRDSRPAGAAGTPMPPTAPASSAARRTILPNLSLVDLSRNAFTHRSAIHAGRLLLWSADTLTEIRLCGNALGDYGLRVLAIYLSKLNLSTLKTDSRLFPGHLAAQHAAIVGGVGADRAEKMERELAALRLGPSTIDLRDCAASARGISEVLAGASRTHRVTRVLLSQNVPGAIAWPLGPGEKPVVATSGELLSQPPFSNFLQLDFPNSLNEVALADVPLSQMCSAVGCRELFLSAFFCCPQLEKLDLSNSFEQRLVTASAVARLMEAGRAQRVLERTLRGRHAQASWQLFLEEEGEVNFMLDDGASLCQEVRVGDVLGELIAHAAYNASVRQRPVPPAFAHLRELRLDSTGLTDMAVRGICIALRSGSKAPADEQDTTNNDISGEAEAGDEEREESSEPQGGGGGAMLQSLAVLSVANNFLTPAGCAHVLYGFVVDWPLQARGIPSSMVSLALEGNAGVGASAHDVADVGRACQAALTHRQGEIAQFLTASGGKGLPLTVTFGPCAGGVGVGTTTPPPVYVASCTADGEVTMPTYDSQPRAGGQGYHQKHAGGEAPQTPPLPPHDSASPTADKQGTPPPPPHHHRSLLATLDGDADGVVRRRASTERPTTTLYPPQPSFLEGDGAAEASAGPDRLVSPSPFDESEQSVSTPLPASAAAGVDGAHDSILKLAAEMPLQNTDNKYKKDGVVGSGSRNGGEAVGGSDDDAAAASSRSNDNSGPDSATAGGHSPPPRLKGNAVPAIVTTAPPPSPPSPPSPPAAPLPAADKEAEEREKPQQEERHRNARSTTAPPQINSSVSNSEPVTRASDREEEEERGQDGTSLSATVRRGSRRKGLGAEPRRRTFFLTYIHPPGHLLCHAMRVLQSPDALTGPAARRALEADLLALLVAPPRADAEADDGATGRSKVEQVCVKYDELVASGTMRLEVTCNERRAVVAQRLQKRLNTEDPEEQERLFGHLMSVLAATPGWDTIEEVLTIAARSSHARDIVNEVYGGSATMAVHQHHGADDTSQLISLLREADNRDSVEDGATKSFSPFVDDLTRQSHHHHRRRGAPLDAPSAQGSGGDGGNAPTFSFARLDLYADNTDEEENGSRVARVRSGHRETSMTEPDDVVAARADALEALRTASEGSPTFGRSRNDPELGAASDLDSLKLPLSRSEGSGASPPPNPSAAVAMRAVTGDGNGAPRGSALPRPPGRGSADPQAKRGEEAEVSPMRAEPPTTRNTVLDAEEEEEEDEAVLSDVLLAPPPPPPAEEEKGVTRPPSTPSSVSSPKVSAPPPGDHTGGSVHDRASATPSPSLSPPQEESGGTGPAKVADSPIPAAIRVQRDPAGLVGRSKTFVMSYAHAEGGILCRGWRLLSNPVGNMSESEGDAADKAEARRCLQEDFLALLQPPDSDHTHAVEEVHIPFEDMGVSSMLPLHVTTNERRAAIAGRLQASVASAGAAGSPYYSSPGRGRRDSEAGSTSTHSLLLDSPDRDSFPRLTRFLLAHAEHWDTLAVVERYLDHPDRAELKRRLTQSYRTLPTLVHYHHGTFSALLKELGVGAVTALLGNNDNNSGTKGERLQDKAAPKSASRQPESLEASASSSSLPLRSERTESGEGKGDMKRTPSPSPSSSARGQSPPHEPPRHPAAPAPAPAPPPSAAPFPPRRLLAGEEELEAGGGSLSGLVVSPLTASPTPSAFSSLHLQQQQQQHRPPQFQSQVSKDRASNTSNNSGSRGTDQVLHGEQELPSDVGELQRQLQQEGKPLEERSGGSNGVTRAPPPPSSPQELPEKTEWERLRENKHKRLLRMAYDSMAAGAIPLDVESQDRTRIAKGKWDGQRVQLALEWEIFAVLYFERPRSFGSTKRALMLVHPVAIGFTASRSAQRGQENHLIIQIQRTFEADSLGVSMTALAQRLDEGAAFTQAKDKDKKKAKGGRDSVDTSVAEDNPTSMASGSTVSSRWMGKNAYTRRLLSPLVIMDVALKSSAEVDSAVAALNASVQSATRAIEKSMEASGVPGGPNSRSRGGDGAGLVSRTPTVP